MKIWWTHYMICCIFCQIMNKVSDYGMSTFRNIYYTSGPTILDHVIVTDCRYVVVRGFLKEKCIIGTKDYYKCPFADNYYRVREVICRDQEFTNICENDPAFYQSCGHLKCPPSLQKGKPGVGVCGEIVCNLNLPSDKMEHNVNIITSPKYAIHRCDGKEDCLNKIGGVSVDESKCGDEPSLFSCQPLRPWNILIHVASYQVCNNICDCFNCFEEANCFNRSVGQLCRTILNSFVEYLRPKFICDGIIQCINGKDEEDCDSGEICSFISFLSMKPTRSLNSRNKCTIPDITEVVHLVCVDYRDQMNCSDSQISPLICNVNGYETTLSEHVICKNHNLCDDKLDNLCVNIDSSCLIHKHRLCDGISDCPRNSDESDYFCLNLVSANMSCIRRMSYNKSAYHFPSTWVMDGVADCFNGIDEDSKQWFRQCGRGKSLTVLFGETEVCDNVTLLKCPDADYRLSLDNVCNGFYNCDSLICTASRKSYRAEIPVQLTHNSIRIHFFCLPGLEKIQMIIGNCENIAMSPKQNIFGKAKIIKIVSNRHYAASINCQDIFGELYLHLVCTEQCKKFIKCPLVNLTHSSCINYSSDERVFTITAEGSLTVVLKTKDGTMRQNVFGCANERCIEYGQVCDLVDDCGDASDEISCANNFRCVSGEFVPMSRKCNGKFDCLDFSDECNAECDNQVQIFSNSILKVTSYTVGILSTVLNSIVIIQVLANFKSLKTGIARKNHLLMIIISLGDLLQGGFLLLVAISDELLNKSNCITQFKWTTSKICNLLGVFSTIGSQISLFSMTILSIIRANGTRSMIRPSEKMPMKAKVVMAAEIFFIFIVAAVLATVPLIPIPALDDFFVRSLAYENNLFVGNLDKSHHQEIITAYYGRLQSKKPSWELIRKLVENMFINGEVQGERIGFYGSNGFCLFNYFVRSDNTQKWFIGFVLMLNMTCVSIIAICYIIVNMSTYKSSAVAGNVNKEIVLRNRKIQRKLAVLITTDIVSWVPFMVITMIHYLEVVDASSWYSVFSIVILPCNSIINPLLILEDNFIALGKKVQKAFREIILRIMLLRKDAASSAQTADETS